MASSHMVLVSKFKRNCGRGAEDKFRDKGVLREGREITLKNMKGG